MFLPFLRTQVCRQGTTFFNTLHLWRHAGGKKPVLCDEHNGRKKSVERGAADRAADKHGAKHAVVLLISCETSHTAGHERTHFLAY
ncbi:MAG: hypothetical protein CL450_09130 [Acidimicrobiaceae bacterium]|nr:hypothetical protein [Acidimicrobiaceae bacterium]